MEDGIVLRNNSGLWLWVLAFARTTDGDGTPIGDLASTAHSTLGP
jgi:hypothetical protein